MSYLILASQDQQAQVFEMLMEGGVLAGGLALILLVAPNTGSMVIIDDPVNAGIHHHHLYQKRRLNDCGEVEVVSEDETDGRPYGKWS